MPPVTVPTAAPDNDIAPSHNTNCECERCKDPEAYEQKLKDIMENGPGWFAHFVFDDDSCPFGTNIHTHGFPEKHKHLDIQICIAMPPKQAHALLWGFVSTLEDNRKVDPNWTAPTGVRVPNMLAKHDVVFLPLKENGRDVLRMILPDPNNKFDTMPYAEQFEGTGRSARDKSWS